MRYLHAAQARLRCPDLGPRMRSLRAILGQDLLLARPRELEAFLGGSRRQLGRQYVKYSTVYFAPHLRTAAILGRDRYTYAELQEHVPAAFAWLRRAYFNRVRRHVKEGLLKFEEPARVMALFDTYREMDVGISFLNLIAARLVTLTPL